MNDVNESNKNLEDDIKALLMRHSQPQNRLEQSSSALSMFAGTQQQQHNQQQAGGQYDNAVTTGAGNQPVEVLSVRQPLTHAFDASSLSAESIALQQQQQQALAIAAAMASSSSTTMGKKGNPGARTTENHGSMEGLFAQTSEFQPSFAHHGNRIMEQLLATGGDGSYQQQQQLVGGAMAYHQQAALGLPSNPTDMMGSSNTGMHNNQNVLTPQQAAAAESIYLAGSSNNAASAAALQQQYYAEQQHYVLLQQLLAANAVGGASPNVTPLATGRGGWQQQHQLQQQIHPHIRTGGGADLLRVTAATEQAVRVPTQLMSNSLAMEKILKKKEKRDKPKRPLSAYNIFFKEERARILRTLPDTRRKKDVLSKDVDEDIYFRADGADDNYKEEGKVVAAKDKVVEEEDAVKKKEKSEDDEKEKNEEKSSEESGKDKTGKKEDEGDDVAKGKQSLNTSAKHRSQRKKSPHGKIGFASLAKQIGHNWKTLEPNRMSYYKKLAVVDMGRYKDEMVVYAAKKQAEREAEMKR